MVEEGFDRIVSLWTPILDEFKKYGVVFALEVHPARNTRSSVYSTKKLLDKFADRPSSASTSIPATCCGRASPRTCFCRTSSTASTTST